MKYFITLLIFSLSAIAEVEENSFDYTRKMYSKVKEIASLSPEDFPGKINAIRNSIDDYISHKKGVCQGDFSTLILNKQENEQTQYKLSNKEQELCYRELKALQVTYINNLFDARKVYLDYMHVERLKRLSQVRVEALKQIQSTFDKKVQRRSFSRKKRKSSKKNKKKK